MRGFPAASAVAAHVFMIALAGGFAIGASAPAEAQTAGKAVTMPSGLQITDSKTGTGPSPKPGQICVMHYTGWLYQNGAKGKKFDSSVDRGQPFEFPIGMGRVIKGWDEGVATMKVAGKRIRTRFDHLGAGQAASLQLFCGTKLAYSKT